MTNIFATGISAVLEPSTVASATTACSRFLDSTAFGALVATASHGWAHCRGCFCTDVGVNTRDIATDAATKQTRYVPFKHPGVYDG